MRTLRLAYNISHKFYSGQGLHLNLNLTKRRYLLKVETIWEDYALVEIQGLTGVKNYVFDEKEQKGTISDQDLDLDMHEKVEVTLKLPEYSSYDAHLSGSIDHIPTFVDSKLRGESFSINILSKGEHVNMKYIQAEKFRVVNSFGKTSIQTLIAKDAAIDTSQLEAQKIMISGGLHVKCTDRGYLRSLLLQNSEAEIEANNFSCDSIQGKAGITAKDKLVVKRWYAGEGGIAVNAGQYELNIETGSGSVHGQGRIILGKDHRGQIETQSSNVKNILYTDH